MKKILTINNMRIEGELRTYSNRIEDQNEKVLTINNVHLKQPKAVWLDTKTVPSKTRTH